MKTGFLQEGTDGRYELQDEKGNYLTYFTSGDLIEIYIDGYGWITIFIIQKVDIEVYMMELKLGAINIRNVIQVEIKKFSLADIPR